jgi:hypothetical protein
MKRFAAWLVVLALCLGSSLGRYAVAETAEAGPDVVVTPLADASADRVGPFFDSLDKNKDGYLSRDEARRSAALRTHWKSLDSNGDNRLSPEELGTGSH